jgi:hypothetical protein
MVECGMSLGFAADDGLLARSLMPKIEVKEFADFSGFVD